MLRTDGGACPSTLLAQVRYVAADVAIENFLDMEYDGLKAELQQSPRILRVGVRPLGRPVASLV